MQKLILTAFFTLMGLQMFSQEDIMQSKWCSQPIVADGLIIDWKQQPSFYDSDAKVFYGVANDSANLYLCFKVTDKGTQMKMLSSGVNVELIKKAKPKRKALIKYPLREEFNGEMPMMNPENQIGRGDMVGKEGNDKRFRESFRLRSENMEIKGFYTKDGIYSVKKSTGIKVAIDWNIENAMFYEVVIPLKEFFGDEYLADYIKTIPLTLKFTINAMERPNLNGKGGMPGSGGMHPGGGMRPGGGQPGGAVRVDMGHGNGPNSATFSSVSFKQKFKLTFE